MTTINPQFRPPVTDDPAVWADYYRGLPEGEIRLRQRARRMINRSASQPQFQNRQAFIDQAREYADDEEELEFLEETGQLPTLDEEEDRRIREEALASRSDSPAYIERFRGYTGQNPTGDPEQDQRLWDARTAELEAAKQDRISEYVSGLYEAAGYEADQAGEDPVLVTGIAGEIEDSGDARPLETGVVGQERAEPLQTFAEGSGPTDPRPLETGVVGQERAEPLQTFAEGSGPTDPRSLETGVAGREREETAPERQAREDYDRAQSELEERRQRFQQLRDNPDVTDTEKAAAMTRMMQAEREVREMRHRRRAVLLVGRIERALRSGKDAQQLIEQLNEELDLVANQQRVRGDFANELRYLRQKEDLLAQGYTQGEDGRWYRSETTAAAQPEPELVPYTDLTPEQLASISDEQFMADYSETLGSIQDIDPDVAGRLRGHLDSGDRKAFVDETEAYVSRWQAGGDLYEEVELQRTTYTEAFRQYTGEEPTFDEEEDLKTLQAAIDARQAAGLPVVYSPVLGITPAPADPNVSPAPLVPADVAIGDGQMTVSIAPAETAAATGGDKLAFAASWLEGQRQTGEMSPQQFVELMDQLKTPDPVQRDGRFYDAETGELTASYAGLVQRQEARRALKLAGVLPDEATIEQWGQVSDSASFAMTEDVGSGQFYEVREARHAQLERLIDGTDLLEDLPPADRPGYERDIAYYQYTGELPTYIPDVDAQRANEVLVGHVAELEAQGYALDPETGQYVRYEEAPPPAPDDFDEAGDYSVGGVAAQRWEAWLETQPPRVQALAQTDPQAAIELSRDLQEGGAYGDMATAATLAQPPAPSSIYEYSLSERLPQPSSIYEYGDYRPGPATVVGVDARGDDPFLGYADQYTTGAPIEEGATQEELAAGVDPEPRRRAEGTVGISSYEIGAGTGSEPVTVRPRLGEVGYGGEQLYPGPDFPSQEATEESPAPRDISEVEDQWERLATESTATPAAAVASSGGIVTPGMVSGPLQDIAEETTFRNDHAFEINEALKRPGYIATIQEGQRAIQVDPNAIEPTTGERWTVVMAAVQGRVNDIDDMDPEVLAYAAKIQSQIDESNVPSALRYGNFPGLSAVDAEAAALSPYSDGGVKITDREISQIRAGQYAAVVDSVALGLNVYAVPRLTVAAARGIGNVVATRSISGARPVATSAPGNLAGELAEEQGFQLLYVPAGGSPLLNPFNAVEGAGIATEAGAQSLAAAGGRRIAFPGGRTGEPVLGSGVYQGLVTVPPTATGTMDLPISERFGQRGFGGTMILTPPAYAGQANPYTTGGEFIEPGAVYPSIRQPYVLPSEKYGEVTLVPYSYGPGPGQTVYFTFQGPPGGGSGQLWTGGDTSSGFGRILMDPAYRQSMGLPPIAPGTVPAVPSPAAAAPSLQPLPPQVTPSPSRAIAFSTQPTAFVSQGQTEAQGTAATAQPNLQVITTPSGLLVVAPVEDDRTVPQLQESLPLELQEQPQTAAGPTLAQQPAPDSSTVEVSQPEIDQVRQPVVAQVPALTTAPQTQTQLQSQTVQQEGLTIQPSTVTAPELQILQVQQPAPAEVSAVSAQAQTQAQPQVAREEEWVRLPNGLVVPAAALSQRVRPGAATRVGFAPAPVTTTVTPTSPAMSVVPQLSPALAPALSAATVRTTPRVPAIARLRTPVAPTTTTATTARSRANVDGPEGLGDSPLSPAARGQGFPSKVEFVSNDITEADMLSGQVNESPIDNTHEVTLRVTERTSVDTRGRQVDTGGVTVGVDRTGRARVIDENEKTPTPSRQSEKQKPTGRSPFYGAGGRSGGGRRRRNKDNPWEDDRAYGATGAPVVRIVAK